MKKNALVVLLALFVFMGIAAPAHAQTVAEIQAAYNAQISRYASCLADLKEYQSNYTEMAAWNACLYGYVLNVWSEMTDVDKTAANTLLEQLATYLTEMDTEAGYMYNDLQYAASCINNAKTCMDSADWPGCYKACILSANVLDVFDEDKMDYDVSWANLTVAQDALYLIIGKYAIITGGGGPG